MGAGGLTALQWSLECLMPGPLTNDLHPGLTAERLARVCGISPERATEELAPLVTSGRVVLLDGHYRRTV